MLSRRLSVKAIAAVLSFALLMGLSLPCRAQENPATPTEPQQQQQSPEPPKHQDAPAPEPHPDLKPLVEAIPKLIDERKYADALQQADALLQQAIEKGDKIGQAYAHRFRARALQRQNQLDEALPAWEQAERLWREIGDGAFLVEALLGRAFCDAHAADFLMEHGFSLLESGIKRPEAVILILNEMGTYWRGAGDSIKALNLFKYALSISDSVVVSPTARLTTLLNIGSIMLATGHTRASIEFYEKSLEIARTLEPGSITVATIQRRLGALYALIGDLDSSQKYYKNALQIYEYLSPDSPDLARTLVSLGKNAYHQGELRTAQLYFEKSLVSLQRTGLFILIDHVLYYLGKTMMGLGDYESAQACFEKSLIICVVKNGGDITRYEIAEILISLADINLIQGKTFQALRCYITASLIYELLNIRLENFSRALINSSRLLYEQGDLAAAINFAEKAVSAADSSRTHRVLDPETRPILTNSNFDSHYLIAKLYIYNNQPLNAVMMLERCRARNLATSIHQRQIASNPRLPKPLRKILQQQQQLNTKRLETYRQLQAANPEEGIKIAQLQRILRDLDQQQRALDERLRREFPDYANLVLPKPLSIQQIRQSLDAGTVLLYHALTEDHLLIVAVSRTEVKGVARKVDSKQLEKQIAEFRAVVGKPPLLRDALQRTEWQQQSQQLYAQLVAPVQGMLKNAQRVLLCPDGVLSQLPWAALIVKTENGKPVYWIERVALHITPSIGVYQQARRVQPASQGAVIAAVWRYGGVDLAQNHRSEVATLLRRSGTGTVLTDLPSVEQEVKALRGLFGKGARVAVNEQATPQRARQLAASARVVHFACHAKADNWDPLGSALLLAPAGSDVGMLTAGEVLLTWRLRADLVILSACETGLGVAQRYEGVYSLGRAFLVAGSRSVGMSLWEVDDESTSKLMMGFYSRYVRGMAKDEALRGAQLELLRDPRYADPYFWSAFVLMGDYQQVGSATGGKPSSQGRKASATPVLPAKHAPKTR